MIRDLGNLGLPLLDAAMKLNAGKLLSHTAITSSLIALNTLALCPITQAQESEDGCAGVIEAVSTRMMRGRNLTIDYARRDNTRSYDNAPSERPIMQVLLMSGSGSTTDAIFNSPAFMQTRATTIIESCRDVGAFAFALKGSSASVVFGLMPDGTVKRFSCSETTPSWGQVLCGGW